jgi:two-component system response regulator RegA
VIEPSCPVIVIHDDDAFRRKLIATLDAKHFSVTFAADGDEAISLLETRKFKVIVLSLDLQSGRGVRALDHIRDHRQDALCGVLILGEPDPRIRTFAPWADETLMKPVDADYVANRARTYCNCA